MGRKSSTRKRIVQNKTEQKQNKEKNKKIEKVSSKQKTIPCEYHKVGLCKKEKECTFLHNFEPVFQDEILCKYNLVGGCQNNPCYFSHDTTKFSCKFLFVSGKCEKGSWCQFSHELFQNEQKLKNFIQENKQKLEDHLQNNIVVSTTIYAMQNDMITQKDNKVQDSVPEFFQTGIKEKTKENILNVKLVNPFDHNQINSNQ